MLFRSVFATLRAASSEIFQMRGHAGCLAFWNAVTNADTEAVTEMIGNENTGALSYPATRLNDFLRNAAYDHDDLSLPFYQTTADAASGARDFVFRPAAITPGIPSEHNTYWEARYNISIRLKNFYGDDALPPDVVEATLRVRPRSTHLKADGMSYTEYRVFFTHIPLEPLRETLFSQVREASP